MSLQRKFPSSPLTAPPPGTPARRGADLKKFWRRVASNPYINLATAHFIESLQSYIDMREDLRSDPGIQRSLSLYKESLKEPYAIASYLKLKVSSPDQKGFTSEQFLSLFIALSERARAAWTIIPEFAKLLEEHGHDDLAPFIQQNAQEEAGSSITESHPYVMFEGFESLSDSLALRAQNERPLAPYLSFFKSLASLNMLNYIRRNPNDLRVLAALETPHPAQTLLKEHGGELGAYSLGCLDAFFSDPSRSRTMTSYAPDVVATVRNGGILQYAFELARRESGSTDDFFSDRLSQIGAFRDLVARYLGPITRSEGGVSDYRRIQKYSDIHGATPTPLNSLEHRHAKDSVHVLCSLLTRLAPDARQLKTALDTDRMIIEKQQLFWRALVKDMDRQENPDRIVPWDAPPSPFRVP